MERQKNWNKIQKKQYNIDMYVACFVLKTRVCQYILVDNYFIEIFDFKFS